MNRLLSRTTPILYVRCASFVVDLFDPFRYVFVKGQVPSGGNCHRSMINRHQNEGKHQFDILLLFAGLLA
jgi:hypothetical protein